ncbi:helix-turn-helix domain-containing protein [Glaciihabitans sp. dw_435]|uniref:helix-turn-helix domain-containing protein n=1 Tax=Glaciihabitans sp. dw_435 TaxID=2720081 RepID=UPI001BD6AA2B|nr:helix-turn-helix domain-containing protein [Glaciihabitans sp. dw_435]
MVRTRRFDETALLEVATQLFWTRGFDATLVAAVSDASAIGNGSIYAAYRSKFGLFRAVFEAYCAARVEVVRVAVSVDGASTLSAVENLFATIIADCASQPGRRGCLMLNSLSELGIREPEITELCARTTADMETIVAGRLLDGAAGGELTATDDECASLGAQLVLLTQGLIQMSRLGVAETKLVSIAATSTAMLPWADLAAHDTLPSIAVTIDGLVRRIRATAPVATPDEAETQIQLLVGAGQMLTGSGTSTIPRTLAGDVSTFIDNNLHDPRLSPTMIARAHHVSVRSLHVMFEGQDDTLSKAIQKRRLERARTDIEASTSSTISSIAARWGFGSAAHFTRLFTKAFGMSPTGWQRERAGA